MVKVVARHWKVGDYYISFGFYISELVFWYFGFHFSLRSVTLEFGKMQVNAYWDIFYDPAKR